MTHTVVVNKTLHSVSISRSLYRWFIFVPTVGLQTFFIHNTKRKWSKKSRGEQETSPLQHMKSKGFARTEPFGNYGALKPTARSISEHFITASLVPCDELHWFLPGHTSMKHKQNVKKLIYCWQNIVLGQWLLTKKVVWSNWRVNFDWPLP